ncbi:hypothetical protein GF376_01630 [Candidatus Peregrinibacteria bacterium]|nr:hypothetical protein [Candidatus Peregrinibacteria bacterium]
MPKLSENPEIQTRLVLKKEKFNDYLDIIYIEGDISLIIPKNQIIDQNTIDLITYKLEEIQRLVESIKTKEKDYKKVYSLIKEIKEKMVYSKALDTKCRIRNISVIENINIEINCYQVPENKINERDKLQELLKISHEIISSLQNYGIQEAYIKGKPVYYPELSNHLLILDDNILSIVEKIEEIRNVLSSELQ